MRVYHLIFALFSFLIFTSSQCDDDGTIPPPPPTTDCADGIRGVYRGSAVESREYENGLEISESHEVELQVTTVTNSEVKLELSICHLTDGELIFDLDGNMNSNCDGFDIVEETFINNKIEGFKITLSGSGIRQSSDLNFNMSLNERREDTDGNPDNDDTTKFSSNYNVMFNRVDTGNYSCN